MTERPKEKPSAGRNPLKFDPELKAMLEKLECVKTYRTFKRWRSSFLDRFESFLEEEGIQAAEKAYKDFSSSMERFVKKVNQAEGFMQRGFFSQANFLSSVKARNCLHEMSKIMSHVIDDEDALIPQTGPLEKQRGYNKFHMGAVLVRDNFDEYGRLNLCGDLLQHMRKESLEAVVDRQLLDRFDSYFATLDKFCTIMQDLGLYELLLKCRGYANEDSSIEDLIFLDLKTGGIGELSREDCKTLRLITCLTTPDDDGNDVFSEAVKDEEAKEKLLKMIKESTTLGIGFGNSNSTYDEEDVNLDAEKIQNMWGVKLRKTPKNKKGEEFIFVDQKTGAFGELSRKMFLERGLLTETQDENGKLVLEEAEADFDERASMIEILRGLLKLGVTKES